MNLTVHHVVAISTQEITLNDHTHREITLHLHSGEVVKIVANENEPDPRCLHIQELAPRASRVECATAKFTDVPTTRHAPSAEKP